MNWLLLQIHRLDMWIFTQWLKIRCDQEGHPITYTCSDGTSSCECGKIKEKA